MYNYTALHDYFVFVYLHNDIITPNSFTSLICILDGK